LGDHRVVEADLPSDLRRVLAVARRATNDLCRRSVDISEWTRLSQSTRDWMRHLEEQIVRDDLGVLVDCCRVSDRRIRNVRLGQPRRKLGRRMFAQRIYEQSL
jgi:hypothetical protein